MKPTASELLADIRERMDAEPKAVLSDERLAEIRAAAFDMLEPRDAHWTWVWSPEYADFCDSHYSDGSPMEGTPEFDELVAQRRAEATWQTGLRTCAICDEETGDGGDLCPAHLHVVEPWRLVPDDSWRSPVRSFDGKAEP